MASIKHFFLLFICFSVLVTSGLADSPLTDCSPDFNDKDCDKECKKFGHPGGYCGPDRAQPLLRMCYCKDR
ncbi:Knottin scorpion toxin-like superfamily [Arabidopsis suecica]|uniref:Knottin scorpion toxin-like superfamily n=1 Tax=Arabidopsis suecica TaxID=45249 RepID=A0A8T2BVW2_ARASU|nr:Knottin scorpion toxin-like superfamily [Arabidopsis suecica]